MPYVIHTCSFSAGCFVMPHPNGRGKQQVWFEDSDQFGPSKVNMRTGDLTPISDTHPWFWFAYDDWRSAGRPVDAAKAMKTPNGLLQYCRRPQQPRLQKAEG